MAMEQRAVRRAAQITGVALVTLLLLSLPFISSHLRDRQTPGAINGQLVEKRVIVQQTKYGSRSHYHLIVRNAGGDISIVDVTPKLYQEAKVGMQVAKERDDLMPTLSSAR